MDSQKTPAYVRKATLNYYYRCKEDPSKQEHIKERQRRNARNYYNNNKEKVKQLQRERYQKKKEEIKLLKEQEEKNKQLSIKLNDNKIIPNMRLIP